MALNLQVENVVSTTAQTVKDQNGNASPLTLSTDKVGIGTTEPETPLHIKAVGRDPVIGKSIARLLMENVLGHKWFLNVWPSHNIFSIGRLGPPDDVHDLFINESGNVGIGTTAPETSLHIKAAGIHPVIGKSIARLTMENVLGHKWFLNVWPSHNIFSIGRLGPPDDVHDLFINESGNVGIGTTAPKEKLEVNGNILATGDIRLTNADCAEDFDICATEQIDPGTVMVLGEEGKLEQSQKAYDKRVAGVVSGAGGYKPGIVLDKQESSNTRQPIALLGKVFCKVDAQYGAIEVGDLLTTSPTPGHAMKADDPAKAFGAVIGKALRPVPEGHSLIPILIALQ